MSIAAREHVKLFAEETAVMRYIEIYRTLAHDSSAAFKESSKRMAEPWST